MRKPRSSHSIFCASIAAERALRVSPIDRLAYPPHEALAIGHFLRGQYEESANAAHRSVQSNPDFSVSHSLLAAALVKLGRVEAAKDAAKQVLTLQPSFSSRQTCEAVGMAPALAEPPADAWRQAGLPAIGGRIVRQAVQTARSTKRTVTQAESGDFATDDPPIRGREKSCASAQLWLFGRHGHSVTAKQ